MHRNNEKGLLKANISFFFFLKEVTEVVEVSQLGYVGSGNKLQKQKKGPWSSGQRKGNVPGCKKREKGKG